MDPLYDHWHVNFLVVLATAATVALVVLVHYECLVWLSARLARAGTPPRRKVLYSIYTLLGVHITEIWMFGIAIRLLLLVHGSGHVVGMAMPNFMDSVYLSAITYTTVGFGDLVPVGALRFLSGTEALTGLVLITWSASFTYIEMEKFWRRQRGE
ncbi:MAG: hypothetical protein RLZZ393_449 [Pseudomonadota bacterium]